MKALLLHFFITLRRNGLEQYLLLKLEILEVIVNTLAPDDKYPVPDCENFRSLFKHNYLENEKLFPYFLLFFLNFHQILKIFLKMIIVIANIFPK